MKIDKIDLFWSYITKIFSFGSSIILLPFLLLYLDTGTLGFWYIFATVAEMLLLLDFGFQNTIIRNTTYVLNGASEITSEGMPTHSNSNEPNLFLLTKVFNAAKKFYFIASSFGFLIGSSLVSLYLVYALNSEKLMSNSYLLTSWGVFLLGSSLDLFYGYQNGILIGAGKIKESNLSILTSKVVYIFFGIIFLVLDYSLLGLATAKLLSSVTHRLLNNYFLNRVQEFKDKLDVPTGESKNTLKILLTGSYKLGFNMLGSFMINRGNLFLIGAFLPLSVVSAYGLTMQIFNLTVYISQTHFNTIFPLLAKYRMLKMFNLLKREFLKSFLISILLYASGVIFIALFVGDFLQIIGSKSKMLNLNYIWFLSLIVLLELVHSTFATFIVSSNKVPFLWPSIVSGIGVLVFGYILNKTTSLGLWSFLIAQFCVQLAYNNWKWPLVVIMELNMRFRDVGLAVRSLRIK